jgi:hypothetical protein
MPDFQPHSSAWILHSSTRLTAGRADGNCSIVVKADALLLRVMMRGKGGEESLELRKKVKIDNIVELYATLLSKLSPF